MLHMTTLLEPIELQVPILNTYFEHNYFFKVYLLQKLKSHNTKNKGTENQPFKLHTVLLIKKNCIQYHSGKYAVNI